MAEITPRHSAPARRMALAVGAAAIAIAGGGWASWQLTAKAAEPPARLKRDLQSHFPRTAIDEVRCDLGVPGLCEVTTGRNVFYASRDGRHVLVGALLDLEAKVDLTDRRIRDLAALTNATRRISGPESSPAVAPPAQDGVLRVNLGRDSALVHNPGGPLKLTVFSDLNCGYCRQLFQELKAAPDIEVTEYPLAILGADSAEKARLALCSEDRAGAAEALYTGGQLEVSADCMEGERRLAANMAFAEANGIAGTPALIRADGALHRGWMSLADLRQWMKAARS